MKQFFGSVKFKILLCLLALMAGFMAYAGAHGRWTTAPQQLLATALVPFQRLGQLVSGGIEGLRARTAAIDEVMAENEQLRQEVARLRQELLDYDDMKAENELYRAYYQIEDSYSDYELVSAFVIGRDPLEKYYAFTIDRGQRDGVAVNDVVISPEGAVGRVTAVGYNYADVLTVLDPAVSMGCTISRTRDIGLGEGDSRLAEDGKLKMSYLPRENLVAAGDLVVTTGLGGVFPPGLVVGTVEDIVPENSGKSMYAVLAPAAEVRTITSVFVITNYDAAARPAAQTPTDVPLDPDAPDAEDAAGDDTADADDSNAAGTGDSGTDAADSTPGVAGAQSAVDGNTSATGAASDTGGSAAP